MAILTLTPSRFQSTFVTGSYAYVVADRAVSFKGELITPRPVTVEESAGVIEFDLTPNEKIDEGEDFTYTVSAYDDCGHMIYIYNIVMPDQDVSIFDLIPEPVKPDAFYTPPLTDNTV